MKLKSLCLVAAFTLAASGAALASDPKLDGAYKFVSVKTPRGEQTDAVQKGMIVVHGKYMAFVQSSVNRKTWEEGEPEAERMKKIVEAYNGLRATAGMFEVQGNVITLHQVAQASPASMGKPSKWQYKLEGNRLMLSPAGNTDVVFTFERLP
ncbi:MAG TPA: hypothetical protein VNO14_18930 [Blastocatellia bacterium]|nr:hypothetical protein [Blastocatellia bacterium]